MERVKASVTLKADNVKWLKEEAEKQDRSFSWMVDLAIQMMRHEQKQNKGGETE